MSKQLKLYMERAGISQETELVEDSDPTGHSKKFDPTKTQKVGEYTVKHKKTEHEEPDDEASVVIKHHYTIHKNGKKVGDIEKHYDDYMGHRSTISNYPKVGIVDVHRGRIAAHNHLGSILGTRHEKDLK